jgi:hypothetical protein
MWGNSVSYGDTHWIGGWVGPRAGLDPVEKGKDSYFGRESNLVLPAYHYTDWNYSGSFAEDRTLI